MCVGMCRTDILPWIYIEIGVLMGKKYICSLWIDVPAKHI